MTAARRDNSIGRWNPAWGPMPVKVRDAEPNNPSPKRNRWRWAMCEACAGEPVSVYGPKGEVYRCAICTMPMTVTVRRPER